MKKKHWNKILKQLTLFLFGMNSFVFIVIIFTNGLVIVRNFWIPILMSYYYIYVISQFFQKKKVELAPDIAFDENQVFGRYFVFLFALMMYLFTVRAVLNEGFIW